MQAPHPRPSGILMRTILKDRRRQSRDAGRALAETILSGARQIAPKDRSAIGASAAPPLLPSLTIPITLIRTCQL